LAFPYHSSDTLQVDEIYDGAIIEVKARSSSSNGDDHNGKRELDHTVVTDSNGNDDHGTSTSDRRDRERDTSSRNGTGAPADSGKRRRMELSEMKIERAERKIEEDGKHIVLIRGLHSQGILYITLSTYFT
jgi:hypothetical protein